MVAKQYFYDGENMNDIGKISHVLKHSNGRCVVGTFDRILHRGYIWTDHRDVLSFILHKSIFLHFVNNGIRSYEKYISAENIYIFIDDDRNGVFPKKSWKDIQFKISTYLFESILCYKK